MNKLLMILCLGLISVLNMGAFVESYNYVNQEDFKKWLETDKPMIVVDIQDKQAFAKQHFKGSIETNSYPVKTDQERAQIDPAVEEYKATGNDVVVICPRGKGGAKRCYDYMKSQGVPEEKLYILEHGIDNWPHRDMVENQK